jgi:alpha-tubulin suppressor-like RCC1 family protein
MYVRYHCLILSPQGTIFVCGANKNGQLGLGDNENRKSLTPIPLPQTFISLATGRCHSIAITDTGEIWLWGGNLSRPLGLGDCDKSSTNSPNCIPNTEGFIKVAAGELFSLALHANGTLWCFTLHHCIQLGIDQVNLKFVIPTRTSQLVTIQKISAADHCGLALDSIGRIWTFSFEVATQDPIPALNLISTKTPIIDIASGASHSLILDQNQRVWAFGDNEYGQLGLGHKSNRGFPVQIKSLKNCTRIWCGRCSSFVENGQGLWGFGRDHYNELGLRKVPFTYEVEASVWVRFRNFVSIPGEQVSPVKLLLDVADVYPGDGFTFFLDKEGNLYSCGSNTYGQLARGNTSPKGHLTKLDYIEFPSQRISCIKSNTCKLNCDKLMHSI